MHRGKDPWTFIFRRYYGDLCAIGEPESNSWDDVRKTLRRTPMPVRRSSQAVVRDFPATTETASQNVLETRTTATQTEIKGLAKGGALKYSRGTQTEPPERSRSRSRRRRRSRNPEQRTGQSPGVASEGPSGGRAIRGSDRCWNCLSTTHRYSACLQPRGRKFCYGCGKEEATISDCPDCSQEWRDRGPYHAVWGHMGKRGGFRGEGH